MGGDGFFFAMIAMKSPPHIDLASDSHDHPWDRFAGRPG
jgi:hypothetical protein